MGLPDPVTDVHVPPEIWIGGGERAQLLNVPQDGAR